MIFMTYWFAAFALIFFALLYLAAKPRLRLAVILLGSAVFHTHFAGPSGVLPIIFLGLVTYTLARFNSRCLHILAITLNVAGLIFYKYTQFVIISLFGRLFPEMALHLDNLAKDAFLPTAPPLAISFFVFEFTHYLAERLKGGAPIRSLFNFAVFSIYWPSIVSGPIKRYAQFMPELEKAAGRRPPQADFIFGSARVAVGFLKKTIADNLTAYLAVISASQFELMTIEKRWLFLAFLGFRILLDFSGYSDMAIGFARMMGLKLPENFNWPYLATSLSDFWRRWHMSLSSWIRDYIYIPLGGNRKGRARQTFNALLAFALCGLWHGAGWNFIIWGLYHGAGLACGEWYKKVAIRLQVGGCCIRGGVYANCFSWLAVQLFVFFGWLLFFYPLGEAASLFLALWRK